MLTVKSWQIAKDAKKLGGMCKCPFFYNYLPVLVQYLQTTVKM